MSQETIKEEEANSNATADTNTAQFQIFLKLLENSIGAVLEDTAVVIAQHDGPKVTETTVKWKPGRNIKTTRIYNLNEE